MKLLLTPFLTCQRFVTEALLVRQRTSIYMRGQF
jgi:hypothetical protein